MDVYLVVYVDVYMADSLVRYTEQGLGYEHVDFISDHSAGPSRRPSSKLLVS